MPEPARRWTARKITVAVLASIGIVATLVTLVAGAVAAILASQPVASNPATSVRAAPTSTTPAVPIAPLTVRPVVEVYGATPELCAAPPPPEAPVEVMTCDIDGIGLFALGPTVLELQLVDVKRVMMPNATPAVQIQMTPASQAAFAEYTSQHLDQVVAFVRTGIVVQAPKITTALDSPTLQFAGDLTVEQVDRIIAMLRDDR